MNGNEKKAAERLLKRLSSLAVLGYAAEDLYIGQHVAVEMVDPNGLLQVSAACEGDHVSGTMIENVASGAMLMIDHKTSHVSGCGIDGDDTK